jgi:S-adenosylmethionine:tRNA ribosyltransferase-isomerase
MKIKEIRIEDYQYELPQTRIALYPLDQRDDSRLLVFRNGQISNSRFNQLPEFLPENSLLIWNNTKVIPARLEFRKPTGALIEIFLLEPASPSVYSAMFDKKDSCIWHTIVGNQKKWKSGPLVRTEESPNGPVTLTARYADENDKNLLILSWSPAHLTLAEILDIFGKTPIPPYLKRDSELGDKTSYQTIYASFDGSVAAPTAGLHFTESLLQKLHEKNIKTDSLTLHVGSGTFIPVKAKVIGDHEMHAETVIIEESTIRDLLACEPDRLTVVGTTSLRSLESLFWLGQKIYYHPESDSTNLSVDQWEPYSNTKTISVHDSLNAVLRFLEATGLTSIQFSTRLMIAPGYSFQLVHRLITNFHQPSSTLLLLVSALIGPRWREVYDFAMANDYRFLSYGDSSLLESDNHSNV